MAIDINIFKNKVIKYSGKEYTCIDVRKTIDRCILSTTTYTLALYHSQVEEVEIIHEVTNKQIRGSIYARQTKLKNVQNTIKYGSSESKHVSHKKNRSAIVPSQLSDSDKEFIVANWSKHGTKKCRLELDISTRKINDYVKERGLVRDVEQKVNRLNLTEENKKFIEANWLLLPMNEISKRTGCSIHVISGFASNKKLPERPKRIHAPRTFQYDADVTANSDVRLFTPPTKAELEAFRKEEETGRKSNLRKIQLTVSQEKHVIENWDGKPMTYFMDMFACTREKFIRSIEHLGLKRKPYANVTGSAKKFSIVEEAYIKKHWDSKTVLQIREDLGITRHVWNNDITSLGLKPKAKGTRERRTNNELGIKRPMKVVEKVPRIFVPKKPVYVAKGRTPLAFSEDEKAYITENWTKTTPAKIRKHLGYSNFAWNNRLHSVSDSLPFKAKPIREPRAPKRSLSAEELAWVRDAWSTKTTEEICDHLNVSYATFNGLVRALNFPRKKMVRSHLKTPKDRNTGTFTIPETLKNRASVDNYKSLLKLAVDAQFLDQIIIFKIDENGVYHVTDAEGNKLWSETINSETIVKIVYKNSIWTDEEKSLVKKNFIRYNNSKNSFIEQNKLNHSIHRFFPIKMDRYKNVDGFQTFDEFLIEQSILLNRKTLAIINQLTKFDLIS